MAALAFEMSVGAAGAADIPDRLGVEGPVVARVHATGFQIYTLKADAAGKPGWTLTAPEATFEGENGLKGKHSEGPTWESTIDGSKVVGMKLAEEPSPDAGAIPWLLLKAKSHEGKGVFSGVTFIQRINTVGGVAPKVGDAKAGEMARVAYSADYVFYGAGATTRPGQP